MIQANLDYLFHKATIQESNLGFPKEGTLNSEHKSVLFL